MNTLHINLFGGPGTGKSTIAAGLFYTMKKLNYKVELITEHAKELIYKEDDIGLKNQLKILAEQNNRHLMLENKVDFTISDSPFIMGIAYLDKKLLPKDEFEKFIIKLYKSFNNLNIFLIRDNVNYPYQNYGRTQSLEEAIKKDVEIKNILDENDIPYMSLVVGDNVITDILLNINTKN